MARESSPEPSLSDRGSKFEIASYLITFNFSVSLYLYHYTKGKYVLSRHSFALQPFCESLLFFFQPEYPFSVLLPIEKPSHVNETIFPFHYSKPMFFVAKVLSLVLFSVWPLECSKAFHFPLAPKSSVLSTICVVHFTQSFQNIIFEFAFIEGLIGPHILPSTVPLSILHVTYENCSVFQVQPLLTRS